MDEASYSEKHRELMLISEHTDALLWQMRSKKYTDLAIFLNNLSHMERYQGFITTLYDDSKFLHWLKVSDTDLYIRIEAIQLSFGILSNLIENLRNVFAPLRMQTETDKTG